MKNIYKYKLEASVWQLIEAPFVKMLDIQIQGNTPCLWAIVDDEVPNKKIKVVMVGTGTADVDDQCVADMNYISTTQIGGYVFHWFWEEV